MPPTVELCVITDSNYVRPTATMLTSAKCNKHADSHYRVHLVSVGIGKFYLRKLQELSSPDFEVLPVEADLSKFDSVTAKTHVSKAALIKFTLCDIFPDIDRLLYMDGDILVKQDLTGLYNEPLEGMLIAGVRDMGGELGLHFNDLVGVEKYINSGVLLMNLEAMRKENVAARMIDAKVNAPTHWQCMDQDVINLVCKGRTRYLPVRYNAMIPLYIAYGYGIEEVNAFYQTGYECYDELDEDAVLIHFAGEARLRPWLFHNGSYAELWQEYTAESPFGNIGQMRDISLSPQLADKIVDLVSLPLTWHMPEKEVRVRRVNLLEKLPIGSIHITQYCKTFKLFGCIPLVTVRHGREYSRLVMFGFLPVFRVKR